MDNEMIENENDEEKGTIASIGDGNANAVSLRETEASYATKYSNLFVFSGGNKAGMQMMDKEKQAQVIYEMSKDSAYFKRTVKLDAEATAKAQKLLKSFQELERNKFLHQRLEQMASQKYLELEKRRVLDRICCVLDMDMFFAAVEIRDRPELKDLPVAVGGIGMISTSNYVARQYGVRAAMPGFIAKKLCPHLVFVKCNFAKYEVVSKQMKEIIAQYDPHYRSYSLDEVYFDLTDAALQKYFQQQKRSRTRIVREAETIENYDHYDNDDITTPSIFALRAIAAQLLQDIRSKICEVTKGLTCSAGMANNFMLAKICADINKPNGQSELPPTRDHILQFIQALSTRKIPGIGKVTEKILSELGIHTLGDVKVSAVKILHAFTPTTTDFLFRASLGIASEEGVDPASESSEVSHRKSIGCERTYSAKGISQRSELYQKLEELCIHLGKDIQSETSILGGKTLTLKIKDIDFNLHTKATTIPMNTSRELIRTKEQLFPLAKELLDSFLPMKVRLLGVSVSKLQFRESDSSSGRQRAALDRFFKVQTNSSSSNTTTSSTATTSSTFCDLSNDNSSEILHADCMEDAMSTTIMNEDSRHGESVISLLSDQDENLPEDDDWGENDHHSDRNENSGEEYTCPICDMTLRCSLLAYNAHIDDCLTLSSLQHEKPDVMDVNNGNASGVSALKRNITSSAIITSQKSNKKVKIQAAKTVFAGQVKLEQFLRR